MDTEAPLFKLRLTTLGDGGCVLGAAWHHSVADGTPPLYMSLTDMSDASGHFGNTVLRMASALA